MEKFSNKPYFSYYEEKRLKELDQRKIAERQKYETEKQGKLIMEKENPYKFVNEWDMYK